MTSVIGRVCWVGLFACFYCFDRRRPVAIAMAISSGISNLKGTTNDNTHTARHNTTRHERCTNHRAMVWYRSQSSFFTPNSSLLPHLGSSRDCWSGKWREKVCSTRSISPFSIPVTVCALFVQLLFGRWRCICLLVGCSSLLLLFFSFLSFASFCLTIDRPHCPTLRCAARELLRSNAGDARKADQHEGRKQGNTHKEKQNTTQEKGGTSIRFMCCDWKDCASHELH